MNYKLISQGVIIDAVKNPCYVRWDKRLKMFMACPEQNAQGIASHDGNTYYQLETRPRFGIDGYETVSAISIGDEEADELIKTFDENAEFIEVSEQADNADDETTERQPTAMERLTMLEAENKELKECILELSAEIFK